MRLFKKERNRKMKNKEEEYKKSIAKRNKIALEANTKAINYLQENKNDIKTLFCAGITESDNKIHVEMNIIGRELSYILHCLMLNDDGIYTAVKEAVDTVTLIKGEQNRDK